MLKKKKNNKGFTLVELLVVIAIIGILAVVAVPSLMKNINKAKATDIISYLSAVKTAAISEYATTQTKDNLDMDDLDKLVEDRPSDVSAATATITNDGKVTMTVTVPNAKIGDEVEEQADASFGAGVVTVTPTTSTTPSGQ